MLRIVNLEEMQGMLLRVPGLVDLQERRDADFVQDVKEWLTKLEKVLENNRLPAAGNVAALRAMLISAEQGVIPAGIEFHGRATGRKIREAAAAYVLQHAGDIVSGVIRKDCDRVADAERMIRQLVSLAKAKGLIRELPSGENFTDILKAIWRTLSADPDISPGTINVEGLIGPHDALVILDRTLTCDIPME
jgi:hypothetical protein